MQKIIYKKNRGFSLIETLIAVAILMIAITGPFALVQAGLFSSNHAGNQIVATYLAQEGIEYVRSVRDANNYYQYATGNTRGWLTGPDGVTSILSTCGTGNGGCMVDPHQGLTSTLGSAVFIKPINDSGNLVINKKTDISGNFISYGYASGGASTGFTRKVIITKVGDGSEEVIVTVTVGWSDNALPRTYTVSENLSNYQIPDPPSGDNLVLSATNNGGTPFAFALAAPSPSPAGIYNLSQNVTCVSVTVDSVTLNQKDKTISGPSTNQDCQKILKNGGKIIADTSNSNPGYCGDKVKNGTEQCDGTDYGGQTCNTLGYTGSDTSLKCSPISCTFDVSQCGGVRPGVKPAVCGDNVIGTGEQCDGTNLGGVSCSANPAGAGYTGNPTCNPNICTLNWSSCTAPVCDGNMNHNEQCNGYGDTGISCTFFYDGATGSNYTDGTIYCSACNFDTSTCSSGGGSGYE